MTTFTGSHEHRIDGKGRVSLPSDFRQVLGELGGVGLLFIVPGMSDPSALTVLPPGAYADLQQWHKDQQYASKRVRQYMTKKILGDVRRVTLDPGGRMVIPPVFRELLGEDPEVMFIGADKGFEIWSAAARAEFVRLLDADVAELPEEDVPDFDLGSML